MYAVTIAFGSMAWRLLYKDEEKAKAAYAFAGTPVDKTQHFNPEECIQFIDDFGQQAFFKRSTITAAMFEDLDTSKVANIEMALHQARTQAGAEQRAAGDPTLRAARATNGRGPAIVSPGFNS